MFAKLCCIRETQIGLVHRGIDEMTLFCKQCNERRLPIVFAKDKDPLWICEKCENFADGEDVIIREVTKEEKDAMKKRQEDFENNTVLTGEKLHRRKGVN